MPSSQNSFIFTVLIIIVAPCDLNLFSCLLPIFYEAYLLKEYSNIKFKLIFFKNENKLSRTFLL